jgi:hypothetical protein
MPAKNDCGCEERLVRRLAQCFGRPKWLEASDVLNVEPEEAEMLVATGLLAADASGEVPVVEVLRFLEEHGAWWVQVRLEKQIEELRDTARCAERRAPSEAGHDA